MKASALFPSKYIRVADLNGSAVVVEISHVEMEEIGGEGQKKPVLYFKDRKKGLVLNRTNAHAISNAYGDESDKWIGKPIELFPTTTEFQGSMVDAIRIRIPTSAPSDETPIT